MITYQTYDNGRITVATLSLEDGRQFKGKAVYADSEENIPEIGMDIAEYRVYLKAVQNAIQELVVDYEKTKRKLNNSIIKKNNIKAELESYYD